MPEAKDTLDLKDIDVKIDKKPEEPTLTPQQTTIALIRSHIQLIEKSLQQYDPRLLLRALRPLNGIRRRVTIPILRALVQQYYPEGETHLKVIESQIMDDSSDSTEDLSPPKPKESDDKKDVKESAQQPAEPVEIPPEVKVYIHLLLVLFAIEKGLKSQSVTICTSLVQYLSTFNRRSLDELSAKVYYYYSLTHEHTNTLPSIRDHLLALHRTASLQHNEPGVASLTNTILRNYLLSHLYTQADTFRLKSTFPESCSTTQYARYLYYTGRIQAVQLHYTDSYNSLSQALRKCPQTSAIGFRQIVTKYLVLVQLLMGDIPERTLFSKTSLKRSLQPYLQLTEAVRVGDLSLFENVMNTHKNIFEKDETHSLIVRLRSNVIKAGLRKINLSYSRISIKDIAAKLKFANAEDAEYMIVKAIADGVIEATVDRTNGYLFSRETSDIYSTHDPQVAFHKRIQFCNELHNEAVKALRFPPNAHKLGASNEPDDDDENMDPTAVIEDKDKPADKKDK